MIKPLVYNSDIKKLQEESKKRNLKFSEFSLIKESKFSEEQIQSNCKRYIDGLDKEFCLKKLGRVKFVQIDNGGKLNKYGRMAKGRQGTISGFPDVMIIVYSELRGRSEVMFIEFKRIGSKSQIVPKENQLRQKEELSSMRIYSEVINNSVFFEKHICKKLRKYVGTKNI